MKQEADLTEQLGKQTQSGNETWPVYVIWQKKKFYQKNLWKMWPKNYNLGQNIWYKIEKSSKTGHDKKSLISTFACFLTAIVKV